MTIQEVKPDICPCCMQERPKTHLDFNKLKQIKTSLVRQTILKNLIEYYPSKREMFELEKDVYGKRPPETSNGATRVQLSILRKELKPYGWTISRSYYNCGYALEYLK